MVAMFAIFRRVGKDGHAAWLDFGYWEILGLIGWTYLAVSILYIPTRRWRWSPLAWLVCLVALNAVSLAHWITFSAKLPYYFWPWNTGCFCLLTMAGVVTSTIVLERYFGRHAKAESPVGDCFFCCSLSGRLAANPAGNLQNTRHSHLGPLLCRRRDSCLPCLVLDLRCAQACPLGRDCQTRRIQYPSHLPASRPLLRDAWQPGGVKPMGTWLARGVAVLDIYPCDLGNIRGPDPLQTAHAALGNFTVKKTRCKRCRWGPL